MTKLSSLIYTDSNSFLCIGCRVCSVNKIQNMKEWKPIKILSTYFWTELKIYLKQMCFSINSRSSVIRRIVDSTLATGICESLNFMVKLATAAPLWQPRTKVPYISVAAPYEEISYFRLISGVAFIAACHAWFWLCSRTVVPSNPQL